MNLIPPAVKKSIKRTLQKVMKWLNIDDLGSKRPFKSLFVGAFLVAGFIPMLTYLLFVSVVVCLGVFLLVVIEGGILIVATVTVTATLILPALIAGGLSLFLYAAYNVLSMVKGIVVPALNMPEKRPGGYGFKSEAKGEWLDEKPESLGKAHFRGGRKAGKDSDGEADDANETKSTFLPEGQLQKSTVSAHA